MTFGEKIRKLRTEAGITQKELADKLNVTYQTVSKWENDTNEPDFSTLKELVKILNCTIEYLFDDQVVLLKEKTEIVENEKTIQSNKVRITTCRDCARPIYSGDTSHQFERKTSSGVKEIVTVCSDCFEKHAELNRKKDELLSRPLKPTKKTYAGPFQKITDKNNPKALIWAIVLGVVGSIITLIVCVINNEVGIGWTIAAPLLVGYSLMATIYCIFTSSFVSDVFMEVASWSIRFPGLIFTWDLEGFMWLIVMKILFFILGITIGIGVFLFALTLSALLSFFSFIPLLIYNKTHY